MQELTTTQNIQLSLQRYKYLIGSLKVNLQVFFKQNIQQDQDTLDLLY